MKRLQISIEPEMDEALGVEAAQEGVSKAALIRRLVARHTAGPNRSDPIDALVGAFDDQPGSSVDGIVYGR